MVKVAKKLFTLSVVTMTILWSVGIAALVPVVALAADCPELEAGDLYKTEVSTAVYLLNADMEYMYFPNSEVYHSWYKDFSGVQVIEPACTELYSQSDVAGVNYRPGSYLVKRNDAPSVYAVLPGNMRAPIGSEEVAIALYGADWSTMVRDIHAFHWANYDDAAKIEVAALQNGMVVTTDGVVNYHVVDGMLYEVEGEFDGIVYTVSAELIASLEMGSVTVTASSIMEDASQLGSTPAEVGDGTEVVVPAGDLSVSLSASTPDAALLPNSTAFNTVLKVNIKAGADAVSITGLKLKKHGYAANTVVGGLLVVDGAGVQHGNTISSLTADAEAELLFSGSPIVIAAGQTETLTFKVHTGDVTSGDFKLELTEITANATITGLPVAGNSFTMTNGSSSVFSATMDLVQNFTNSVSLDTQSVDAFDFKVTVTNSNEDVYVDKVVLYQAGTASDTDYKDVTLYNKSGDAVAVATVADRYVTFDLSSAPVLIEKGGDHTFTVKLSVVSGASRNIRFYIQENDDVMLRGANSGAYVLATLVGSALSENSSYPLGDAGTNNTLSIASGTLTVSESETPTTNVATGESSVVLGRFLFKPNGENMELRKMKVVAIQGGGIALTGTVYVKVNGATVYSVTASSIATSSQANIGAGLTSATAITMSTYYNMPADEEAVVEIIGSISSSATTADSYGAGVLVTEVKRVSTNDIVDPSSSNINSTARAVSSAALAMTNVNWLAGTYSVIKGDSQVTLAKFTVDARTSGENVRINSFNFVDTTGGAAAITDLSNLKIYEEGVVDYYQTTNSTSAISATSSITFTFKTPIIVDKSAAARTFYVKADVASGATTDATHQFTVSTASNAVGVNTAGTADTVAGIAQTATVSAGGTLLVATSFASGDSYNANTTVNVGASQEEFTVFTFKANDENVKVTTLNLTATGTLSYTDYQNVSLYLNDATTPFAVKSQCTSLGTENCTFTSADSLFEIPAGQTYKIRVKADISGQGGAVLGDTLRFQIDDVDSAIVAKGKSTLGASQVSGTPTISYYKQIAPFGVIVTGVSPSENSSQTKTIAASTVLGQFKVMNNGTAAITLVTTTLYDGGSNSTSSLVYDIFQSDANSVNPTGSAVATSTKSSNALAFVLAGVTLQPGEYRTFTVKVGSTGATGLASGDTFQLYVSSIGDILYSVAESALGYDGNADGDTGDSLHNLFITGKPQLGTFVKQ